MPPEGQDQTIAQSQAELMQDSEQLEKVRVTFVSLASLNRLKVADIHVFFWKCFFAGLPFVGLYVILLYVYHATDFFCAGGCK